MSADVPFRDIRRVLEQHGWVEARVSGSHHIFIGLNRPMISIPVHRGKVKRVYQRHVEKAIKEVESTESGES